MSRFVHRGDSTSSIKIERAGQQAVSRRFFQKLGSVIFKLDRYDSSRTSRDLRQGGNGFLYICSDEVPGDRGVEV
jgi:hypothetical protein